MSIGQGVLLRFCRLSTRSVLVFIRMVPVGLISFALLLPANAQYWGDPWGGRQQQAAAPLPLPPPTQPSTAPSRRASRPRRRAVGLTISVGRVARSMSSRARSSRQRLTQRRRMPAPNPPSLPSARRRWMPTLRSRSRPSVGRAHDPNPSPWSNSARTSHSSDSPASSRFPAMPGSLS